MKLYIGVVLEIEGIKYYVPVSSFKEKHKKLSNGIDFQKIKDSKSHENYAVINLNNMIPVPDKCLIKLDYTKIEKYRFFKSELEKHNYIFLLEKEMNIIKGLEEPLKKKAAKLYDSYDINKDSPLFKRCCNFKLLKEKCLEYESSCC